MGQGSGTFGRYDATVAEGVTVVAGSLSVLCLLFAGLHPWFLDGGARATLLLYSSASAALLGVLASLAYRNGIPPRLAHPITAAAVLILVGNSVLHVLASGEVQHTSTAMLGLIAFGAALIDVVWFVGAVIVTWALWIAAVVSLGLDRSVALSAVAMLGATALAALVNLARRRSLDALLQARDVAEAASVTDDLTGVVNRRGLALVADRLVEVARRQGDAVHCVFVDVDDLTRVNDELGHEAGDQVLVAVAGALQASVRATDVVARWGGDEFCVVGPGPGTSVLDVERRVRTHLEGSPPVDRRIWEPRISSGAAMLAPWDAGTVDTLLDKADQEMYLRRALRRGPRSGPIPPAATAAPAD